MGKAFAGHIGPGRGIRSAGAEISDRAFVAEPPNCMSELLVVLDKMPKIVFCDLHQVGAVDGSYGRGARDRR